MDVHSQEIRSYNMSCVKSKNTKPEEMVRKFLFSKGFRYRKNDKKLLGHPDIVLPKYKTVIFINGCFWHMHENCKSFSMPKSNVDFWKNKLMNNKSRDNLNCKKLEELGWTVLVVWECELKIHNRQETLNNLISAIKIGKIDHMTRQKRR